MSLLAIILLWEPGGGCGAVVHKLRLLIFVANLPPLANNTTTVPQEDLKWGLS